MLEQIINVFEVNTDAIATNRGFYYQYLTILKKWIHNFIENNDIDAYSEVDQDIKEVGESLLFTQVKCYTSNFSLNSKEVKNTIFNFFILYLKNKDLISDVSFCFTTNTKVAASEKLLSKWIYDEKLEDNNLRVLCCHKIKEVLYKEIKNRKNKNLNKQKSIENRDLIKSSTENLIQIVNLEIENFTKSIKWKFENLVPNEAINKIKFEIEKLLENEKFQNRPISLLFGVLISEIYKRSQDSNPLNRCLTKKVIENILNHSDEEIERYLNVKFFKLINIDIELLRTNIQSIQSKVEEHDFEINSLKKTIVSGIIKQLPKNLNLIPDYTSINIYDWENFLITINTELVSRKLVSIFSHGGMGKTSFAKKYLKTYSNYNHIVWITVENSILNAFALDEILIKNLNLDFSPKDDIEHRFKVILNELAKIKGENLVIVDIQELEEDKAYLNQFISLSNWQKLILTRNNIKTISSKKLPKIEIENAKSIFQTYCNKEDIDNKLLTEFIDFVEFNVLVIELTAKTIENSFDLTLEQFFTSLKEQNLNDEDYNIDIDLPDENNSIKIFNYLLKKFSFKNLKSNEYSYLEYLSLLPSRDIIIEDIILINGLEHYKENKVHIMNILISLDKKGLIEFTSDKKRVNIHKIIKELVLYNERETLSPFVGNIFYITWLTARIKEGKNNPSISYRYLKYAQSILDNIKEKYRRAVYQPLIMLENELLYSYRFYIHFENELDKWIDLASRAEKYQAISNINLGVIYNNLGLAYAHTDYGKALEQFKKALDSFNKSDKIYQPEIITVLNNISNVYLMNNDIVNALDNFKKIQNFRKKHNIYNDQQLVIEYKILAESYKMCGDIKKAIEFMSEGIKLHFTLKPEIRNDFFLSACYNYLSKLFLLDNNLDMGILHQENAINILSEMGIKNSEHLLLMYEILRQLYKVKGLSNKEKIIIEKINTFKIFEI
ncbi:tetratricopeptide repeat protein [Flavobacterium luminosum]|uniref:Tetratricopeptide repeat protein n=1 Tax=Flavobacterium luminosum TaxID=2949086 RepID=A0ABT0TR54_9FLAO|nr:tetratricopeptide repeat protein [Flavobacterium sp. HXWNR70]MCL9809979.1 tetratricopeptide repeat protein [Flavobacterium sp. HXWNR70]